MFYDRIDREQIGRRRRNTAVLDSIVDCMQQEQIKIYLKLRIKPLLITRNFTTFRRRKILYTDRLSSCIKHKLCESWNPRFSLKNQIWHDETELVEHNLRC